MRADVDVSQSKLMSKWGRLSLVAVAAFALALAALTAIPDGGSFAAAPPAAGEPSKGRIPNEAIDDRGQANPKLVPDFISALARDGSLAGYVPKAYILNPGDYPRDIPVFADDLKTRVGTMMPGKGFVPSEVSPDSVPDFEVHTGPEVDEGA